MDLIHPRRLPGLAYALAVYVLAGVSVPALLLFGGGYLLPVTVDDGPVAPAWRAIAGNTLLLLLFGLQHSLMARPIVKRWLARVVPEALVRSTYVLATCVVVLFVFLAWRPIDVVLWRMTGVAGALADATFVIGFVLVYVAALQLDHFHLLGLRQAVRWYLTPNQPASEGRLRAVGPYTKVRHPLMTGLLLCFWGAGTFTAGRLLWAVGLSAYVVVGTALEERDLITTFGNSYRQYRTQVPAFLPLRLPRAGHRIANREDHQ